MLRTRYPITNPKTFLAVAYVLHKRLPDFPDLIEVEWWLDEYMMDEEPEFVPVLKELIVDEFLEYVNRYGLDRVKEWCVYRLEKHTLRSLQRIMPEGWRGIFETFDGQIPALLDDPANPFVVCRTQDNMMQDQPRILSKYGIRMEVTGSVITAHDKKVFVALNQLRKNQLVNVVESDHCIHMQCDFADLARELQIKHPHTTTTRRAIWSSLRRLFKVCIEYESASLSYLDNLVYKAVWNRAKNRRGSQLEILLSAQMVKLFNKSYNTIPREHLPDYMTLPDRAANLYTYLIGRKHLKEGYAWNSRKAGLTMREFWVISGMSNPMREEEDWYIRREIRKALRTLQMREMVAAWSMSDEWGWVTVKLKRAPADPRYSVHAHQLQNQLQRSKGKLTDEEVEILDNEKFDVECVDDE